MSEDLGLPPRRALPDDIRDRLRAELRRGIAKRHPSRVWYAAAAAVVVLAAGAVVATKVIRQPAEVVPAPPAGGGLTLDAQVAKSSLDRCFAAFKAMNKAADGWGFSYAREEWVPMFTQVEGADAVVAATGGGESLVFCETTETTVTLSGLSNKSDRSDTVSGLNFTLVSHSATGTVGGILGPGAEGALLESATEGQSMSQDIRFSPVTRQFVVMTRTDPARTTLTLDNRPEKYVLPAGPPPLLSVVDRPVTADRTSPAGRALGECLAAAEEVLPDAAAYLPGPLLETDGYRVVLGRRGDRVVICTTEPDYQRPGKTKSRVYPDFVPRPVAPVRLLRVSTLGATEAGGEPGKSRTPYAVAVPVNAAKTTVDFGVGKPVEAAVVDGMALTWIPKELGIVPDVKVHVVVRDAHGTILYDGSLPLA
ncbi:hypothetical protein [Amycolatopsis vastitatis]|uniref:Uncharacterized protein n=1 Tax=Amycolatopsis vastitatis TaxID=1905142 RepID=A0A229T6H9_9PSEU|nr:hypothetical protein [Amycolatopsis vastitatis]OXM66832.1 hypothetical protein CF165_18800 [Amycolatopsis vastitatis]